MKRILITGVTGFVGKNLVRHLDSPNSFKIIGHSRDPEKARALFENIDFIPGLTSVLLDRYMVQTVIHLAGIAHDLSGEFSKEDYLNANYKYTCELFDAAQNSGVENFIFISSIKALTDQSNQVVDEDFYPDPKSDYGISKRLAEQYILDNARRHTKTFILRPSMIHGPGNKGNLNVLYNFVRKGLPYPLAAFDNRRSYLSIDNFCFVIENILNGKIKPGEYLLADNESISTNELVQLMAQTNGWKIRQLPLPKGLIRMMAKIGTAINVPFNSGSLTKLIGNMEISNQKLLSEIGDKLPVKARQGLMKTIRSFDG